MLVDRAEAQAICRVNTEQFDRRVRTKRLENCGMAGDRELYRSAQCRAIAAERVAA